MNKSAKQPSSLSKESQKLWVEIVVEWSLDDCASLEILRVGLQALDRLRSSTQRIKRDGQIISDRFGQAKPHPLLTVERDSRAAFLAAMKQLNLETNIPTKGVCDSIGKT